MLTANRRQCSEHTQLYIRQWLYECGISARLASKDDVYPLHHQLIGYRIAGSRSLPDSVAKLLNVARNAIYESNDSIKCLARQFRLPVRNLPLAKA